MEEFPRDRHRVGGRYPYCKACHRANQARQRAGWSPEEVEARRLRQREAYARWRASDLTSAPIIRAASQLRRYGLSPKDYEMLLAAQGGTCAFSNCPVRPEDERHGRLHVDHCHVTGMVRGLLCFAHNAMLGHAADDVVALQDGAAYLAAPPAAVVFPEGRRRQRGLRRAEIRALVTDDSQSRMADDEISDLIRARLDALRPTPHLF